MTSTRWGPTARRAGTERTRTSPAGEAGSARGFTLIELLVVLAILGLVAAVATPALQRTLPGLQLRSDAATVATALREARGLAIGRNAEVALVIDLDLRTLRLGDGRPLQLTPGLGIELLTASGEIVDAGSGGIRFYPDGTSSGGRVSLTRGSRTYHVGVDWLTGRVTLGR